ncbi:MAG: cytochrome c1 [Acidiferrobacterales bacterium]|nr:cytochrome c1 [Acidiferrobacterales bacterium]
MKTRLIIGLVGLTFTSLVLAAGSEYHLDHAPIDVSDDASLQRGAKYFVNYCMGCHSAQYHRYSRLAKDASMSDEQVMQNLVFTADTKIGDTMKNAMPTKDAKKWFGAAPPDLSLIARSRGADYLYTYLRTFYVDETRPWGVNNAVFPSVGMPHVLWELQGWQEAVHETVTDAEGKEKEIIAGVELVKQGSLSPPEFDAAMADLVNFLVYVAEPIQLERKQLGIWVLLYLVVAFVVFYMLKKEYWKDVH